LTARVTWLSIQAVTPTPTTILDSFRLDGRVALVTGGGRGLGRMIATTLAQAGADIAITSRTAGSADATAEAIASATGRRVRAFALDVTIPRDIPRLVDEVQGSLGPVDILINNAGLNIRGPIQQLSEADWDAVIDTNLKGPFLIARAIGPAMAARGWGRVVNLASILGVVSLAERTPYCSSKSGIIGLTRVLALEWAGTGVTVNALCPGVFGTEMNTALLADPVKKAEFMRRIPMGRLGDVDELAGAVLFLSSPASSYVTGTSLFVDGGWTAW
jgi:NAD(P)-dependent dehydrogenase (short-subunit alcohol dehydrogenase family)